MKKKLTPTDERYLKWKEERDLDKRIASQPTQVLEEDKSNENLVVEKGQSVIVLKSHEEAVVTICPKDKHTLTATELLAIGLMKCPENKQWTENLIKRTSTLLKTKLNIKEKIDD